MVLGPTFLWLGWRITRELWSTTSKATCSSQTYHRYVDEFIRWGVEELANPSSPYESLRCPGGVVITRDTKDPERLAADSFLAPPPDAGIPSHRA